MQMQITSSTSQPPQGLLQDLILTPITQQHTPSWTTIISNDQDPQLFPTTTFYSEQDDSLSSSFLQLISSSFQPTFPNLETFSPLDHVSNSWSYEQQQQMYDFEHECYHYDDKPRSMVSVLEDDKFHEEQKVVVSGNQISDAFSMRFSGENKSKSKKIEGQPSKNLMAERRRRKRLNDRLTMLRSIVPRISKMDRTSILGDTIDYIKELLEKIRNLEEHDMESDSHSLNLMGIRLKESKGNDAHTRNQAKFEVERRNSDTRIQIFCSMKPGLLLSTVNTLEALGLDIQQCVISSFSDFTLEASCSEVLENRVMKSSEEIKQLLFRNAGYGGRNL